MIDGLIHDFQRLYDKPPAWAWPVVPSIPFVGYQYERNTGIMIYASAENLAWMHTKHIPERYHNDDAWNRYRCAYEEEGRHAKDFFPVVGIKPVTDGGLLAAGLYTAMKADLPHHDAPRAFLETLAISNWCKFTIKDDKNKDYITDIDKLSLSLPYVIAELAALRPGIILIPKAVRRNPILAQAMRGASPHTTFVPIPQFNSTVVNCHLSRYDAQADHLRAQMDGNTLSTWMDLLVGFNKKNAWRYIALLDDLLTP